eukprot:jgi/Mesen1/6740/ME000344S06020
MEIGAGDKIKQLQKEAACFCGLNTSHGQTQERSRRSRRRRTTLVCNEDVPSTSKSSPGSVKFVVAGATVAKGTTLWAEDFVSGATASILSKLILQPFDTTKTILQASQKVRGNYTNLLECGIGLVKTKGTLSLYRGLLASVAVSAPSSAVFFTAYEHVKTAVHKLASNPDLPLGFLAPLSPIIAAALGNVVSSVVRVPPEVIKQRVQADMYRDMFHAVRDLWAKEGLPGFYTGYTTMVARDIPYAAIQFTVFEQLKKRRQRILRRRFAQSNVSEDDKLSESAHFLSNFWMGAVSGAVASVLTAPIDVVKTRVMTQELIHGGAYLGMRQTFAKIWVEEGIVAFGRGLAPRVLYKVPASAVFLVCYEGIRRILRSARTTRELKRAAKAKKAEAGGSESRPPLPARPGQLAAGPTSV